MNFLFLSSCYPFLIISLFSNRQIIDIRPLALISKGWKTVLFYAVMISFYILVTKLVLHNSFSLIDFSNYVLSFLEIIKVSINVSCFEFY